MNVNLSNVGGFFHVCLGYTTFCKYLIGLRDSRSSMLSVHAFWGGREGGRGQDFAKAEAGKNSLCILAFLQETNVIFWDIKGPVCGFFCN